MIFLPRQHIHLSLPLNKFHPLNKWNFPYQDSCGLLVFKGQDVTTWPHYLDGAVAKNVVGFQRLRSLWLTVYHNVVF